MVRRWVPSSGECGGNGDTLVRRGSGWTRRVFRLPEECCDAKVAKEDCAVIVDEEVGGFDVPVDETVDVKVAGDIGWGER